MSPKRLRCFNTWYPAGGALLEGYGTFQRWSLTGVGSVLAPKDLTALWDSSTNHSLPCNSSYPLTCSPVSLFVSISASLPLSGIVALGPISCILISLTPSTAQWLLRRQHVTPNSEGGVVQELEFELRQPGDHRKIINTACNHRQQFICQTFGYQ